MMIGLDVMATGHTSTTPTTKRARAIVGAIGPAVADIKPFLLTTLPADDAPLAGIYRSYLGAWDNTVKTVTTRYIAHPVTSRSFDVFSSAMRRSITDTWQKGDRGSQIAAIQMLAGMIGYFNARFVSSTGEIDWDSLGDETWAGIAEITADATEAVVDATTAAGKAVVDGAKDIVNGAKDIAGAGWSMIQVLVYGGLSVAAAILIVMAWKHGGAVVGAIRGRSSAEGV